MKKWIALLSFCSAVLFLSAQQNSLLYSIKKEGIPTSYLYGTMHLIPDSAYYFPAKLEKYQEKADVLVLEIANPTDQAAAQKLLILDSGSMFDHFTASQKDSVVNWGSRLLGMSPATFKAVFEKMKPFVLLQISTQAAVNAQSRSYEGDFMKNAVAHKQPIAGLETMESQLNLFDNLPDSVLVNMIMGEIRYPEKAVSLQQQMIRLYQEKNVEALISLIIKEESSAAEAEQLVFNRNRNWIPVMQKYMQTKSCFFAVGAGHLGGKQGIIQLLKNAGYTVTPLNY